MSVLLGGSQGSDHRTLASKIDHLFRTVLRDVTDKEHARDVADKGGDDTIPRRKRQWTQAEVASEIGRTPEYLHQLRKGERTNPGIEIVIGIARVFGVPAAYLVDDGISDTVVEVDQQLAMLQRVYEGDGSSSLADRLNILFDTLRPDGGPAEYTNAEVAAHVGTTEDEIRGLRDGTASDVGIRVLRSLAGFFGVPVTYLVGGDDTLVARVDQNLAMLGELRAQGVLGIALAAARMRNPAGREALQATVQAFLQIEAQSVDASVGAGVPEQRPA